MIFNILNKPDLLANLSKKDIFLIYFCFIFIVFMCWVNFIFFPLSDSVKVNSEKYEETQKRINDFLIKVIEEKNKLYANNKNQNDDGSKYKISFMNNEDIHVMIDNILSDKLINIKLFRSHVDTVPENKKNVNKNKIYEHSISIECFGLIDDLIMVVNILESMPWHINFEKINISNYKEKLYLLSFELKIKSMSDNIIQFSDKNNE